MDKSKIVYRMSNQEDAWSVEDYIYYAAKLSNYNIGGVPLHFLVMSSWFVPSNCELLAMWFSKVIPNGKYVEGTLKTYRELAKDNENPYKCKGFHVWIEYVDLDSGEEKVLDPCSFSVYNKEYFYKFEEVNVISKTPCSEVKCYESLEPSKDRYLDDNDSYRLAFLLNTIRTFTISDYGSFKDTIDEYVVKFVNAYNLKNLIEDFNNKYAVEFGKKLGDVVSELFINKDKFSGKRFNEQLNLLSRLIERINDIKARGYMTEDGNFSLYASNDKTNKKTNENFSSDKQKS